MKLINWLLFLFLFDQIIIIKNFFFFWNLTF
jgi:hypothetical protein